LCLGVFVANKCRNGEFLQFSVSRSAKTVCSKDA
jgi:hypothetical protein